MLSSSGIQVAVILSKGKARHRSSGLYSRAVCQAAFFFAALNFAHRARAAAAMLFLPAAEIFRVRFTGAEVAAAGFDPFRACAHRFFCPRLIRLRADADNVR